MKTLLFVVIVLWPVEALACSCFQPSVQRALTSADAVFTGEAVEVQYVDRVGDMFFGEKRIIVTVKVSEYWKGNIQETMKLHTVYNRISCGGYFFKKGGKYIIYAYKGKAKDWLASQERRPQLRGIGLPRQDDDIWSTSICTRTIELSGAGEDLKELGQSKIPSK